MTQVYSFYYDSSHVPSAPVVEITLSSPDSDKNVVIRALVDSGADATVLPVRVLQQIAAKYIKTTHLRTGDERRILVNLYRVSVQLAGHTLHSVKAVGLKDTSQAVMGRDVLNHFVVTLDGVAAMTEVHG